MTLGLIIAFVVAVFAYVVYRKVTTRVVKVIDYCSNVQRCKIRYVDKNGTYGIYLTLPSDKVVGPFTNVGELEKFAITYLNYDPKK